MTGWEFLGIEFLIVLVGVFYWLVLTRGNKHQ